MNDSTPQDRARRRSQEEPGAHSGAEDPAHRRTVPGTASAAEGYRPGEGTAGGEALTGVERDDEADEDGGAGRESPDGTDATGDPRTEGGNQASQG
ncbi:hypothetical protein ACLGI4_07340 [Streptomyces sp. HMX112]|uniref:hypothetical protein n=1 Tax=Streptomyces sp. HMX112 TaxID=3390850 RepID=UPI003A7FA257